MFDPVTTAPLSVQVHVVSALAALVLTPVQFWRPGGRALHKQIGYMWVAAMALTSLSSFWIAEIRLLGPFSPIHLLSCFVLCTLVISVAAARRGNIYAHRRWLESCAFWGLGVAGLFTLLPGRRMSETVFAGAEWLGFAAASVLLCAVWLVLRQRVPRHVYAASALMR